MRINKNIQVIFETASIKNKKRGKQGRIVIEKQMARQLTSRIIIFML